VRILQHVTSVHLIL